jgi:hypothetical protein
MRDVLRYTYIVDTQHFTEQYQAIADGLMAQGFSPTKVANTFRGVNRMYKGVNTNWTTPDGYEFEVQFHTPESMVVKEANHVLYEEARKASTSAARRDALEQQMRDAAATIPTPPGIDGIKDL